GGGVCLAKMSAARLLWVERVEREQLAELQEVGDPAGVLERLVQLLARPEHANALPELLAQRPDLADRLAKALGVARHPDLVPHHVAERAMEAVDRAATLNAE